MGITAIIRPVSNVCNLNCRYCYAKRETDDKEKLLMSINLTERVIYEFMNSNQHRITFLWHGGEPLLAGLDYFEKVMDIQTKLQKNLSSNLVIVNSLQTNGTMLDDKIVAFLKTHKFQVGLSIDGFQKVHDANRITKKGEGSHKLVMHGLNLLQRHKINFGVVAVVTKESLRYPEEILSFFINHNIFNIHFLPYAEMDSQSEAITSFSISVEEYGEFLEKIFYYWKSMDNPLIKIRVINNLLQGLIGGRTELCTFSCHCQSYILVETNGDLYICGRNANNPEFFIGNIIKNSIQDIFQNKKFGIVSERLNALSEDCRNCKLIKICKGGCGHFKSGKKQTEKDYFCAAYRRIADLIIDWLKAENIKPSLQ